MSMFWQAHLNPKSSPEHSRHQFGKSEVWFGCSVITYKHTQILTTTHVITLSAHSERSSGFNLRRIQKKKLGPVWTGVFHHIWMRGGQFAFWMQSHMQWCNITLPTLFSCNQGADIPRRVVVVRSAVNDTQRSSFIPIWPCRGDVLLKLQYIYGHKPIHLLPAAKLWACQQTLYCRTEYNLTISLFS